MILRVPYFYKEFACLADRCKDSCCIGWEIDIDPDTYEYYAEIDGEFGKRLEQNIRVGRETSFVLKDGRCPFLNDRNLCDICTTLGEESLCEICTEYPRFTLEYADVKEKCLGISCEEAGRLIFESTDKITFEETVLPVVYEEEYENKELIPRLEQARDHAIEIMQERSIPVVKRIALLLLFAKEVQDDCNEYQLLHIDQLEAKFQGEALANKAEEISEDGEEKDKSYELFLKRLEVFRNLEVLDEEWQGTPDRLERLFAADGGMQYKEAVCEFMEAYREREYEYEHLMVYFIFRYGMKSAFDCNFLSKIQLGAASFLMIRDMDVERYLENGREFSFEDRIDVARIYSKEVEHSEDNLEQLAEDFMFEELFELYEMHAQILA